MVWRPDTANAIAETALGFIKRAALESEACRALAFSELVGALGGGELGKNRVVPLGRTKKLKKKWCVFVRLVVIH